LRLLLDTHTLLWFALSDPQLSGTATALIMDPGNEKLVSPASYWEIAIKISIKKYVLEKPYEVFRDEAIDRNGFGYLHIEPQHTAALTALPFHHKDPFSGTGKSPNVRVLSHFLVENIFWGVLGGPPNGCARRVMSNQSRQSTAQTHVSHRLMTPQTKRKYS